MNYSGPFQHDTVVQTLYSGRCNQSQALYFDYALAQARADVFFALLFGGRVICSAGSFFDSALAIRIFGELFDSPRFKDICERYKWYPLRLNTDNPREWVPKDYLLNRWRSPNIKLGLFREGESDFEVKSGKTISEIKRDAAEFIERDQYGRLGNIYEPFLADYSVPRDETSADRGTIDEH